MEECSNCGESIYTTDDTEEPLDLCKECLFEKFDRLESENEKFLSALKGIQYHLKCDHLDMGGMEKSKYSVSRSGAKAIAIILSSIRSIMIKLHDQCCCFGCSDITKNGGSCSSGCESGPTYDKKTCEGCPKFEWCDVPKNPDMYNPD